MKRITMILCSLLAAACAGNQPTTEQNSDATIHCHIEGKVHDRPQSDELWLFVGIDGMVAQSSRPHTIIEIRGGEFSCDLYLDEPQYCELVFEDELSNGSWHAIDFVADNCTVKMDLYPEADYAKTKIEGTGATAEYQSYKLAMRKLQEATNKVRDKLKAEGRDESPEMEAERERYNAERKDALLAIVEGEPSVARLAMLARQMVYRLPDQEFIDAFEEIYAIAMPENTMTHFCRRQIDGHSLQVGNHYVDFEAPDLNGEMHRLSEMVVGAKLVLLDLWASWCAPCRRASMEMMPLYEQYRSRGFMVIGVARESESTEAMEAAIRKDGYTWPQLVELDDRANIWSQYGCVNAAGRRILFNDEGEILAFDPTIEQLTAEVEKHLGAPKTE
ncbi:MAG: TlpA family protein disulfide reductase [Rikenellaceae bacterium]|nr:TlpA family protein disulfide reductase [Rikenellaceae bacterium]